ncbi:MAG: phage tail tape measure protein [Clostridium sp.]|jgi:TP901 family phage tail tape measure protein|uniref:phage tail tape measure protein n=1 Tax=Clostridium sp. TaxID=1506 RepID=UPI0025C1F6B4|nr:phage tail tape measure protein [Clostridium sp.]MCH3962694.1 phage tail tape measure protein [Clostridium sp.]MCI2201079.1 phage tail tape measure protein [Clostridium sp.]
MQIFSLVGSILLKDNDTKGKLKDIDNTAKQTGNSFDSVFDKMGSTAVKIGGEIGTAIDNIDKKFQLWMAENKKTASSSEVSAKALETYKGKMQALSEEIEKSQKALKGVADEFGKGSTEYKEAENRVIDLKLKYKELEDESGRLQKATNSINFKKIAESAASVGSTMTMKFTTPILGALGLAAKSATSFEHQMADIRKEIVASGVPIAQVNSLMSQMSKSSIAWSEDFGQSTDDINEGLLTLVKDGYSADEAMKIMHNSLYAARGANEDLSTTVDGLGSSLEAFGLKTNNAAQTVKNMSKLTDAFAYVSNHTKGSMSSLSEASSIMGSTFTALKIPMTQAASAIGILQSNGIDASTAANSLKAGLVNLVNPTDQMSAAMQKMHLEVFNVKGQMKDLPTILNDIEKGTKGWTDQQKQAAIATLFGKESLSSWNVLLNKGGDHLGELSKGAENATGEVQKLSDAMKDTPENQFKELKESVHALGIAFGQDVLPVLTPFIKSLTDMIKAFSNLDDGTKKVILTFAGITAATGPLLSIFGHTYDNVNKLNEFLDRAKIGEKLSGIFTKVPKVAPTAVFTGLVNGLSIAGAAISRFITGPWLLLGNSFKALPNLIRNFSFAGIAEKIITPFKNIPTLFTGIFGKVPGIFTGFRTVLTGFASTIISLGPKVITGIRSMFSIQGIMTGARAALGLFTNPWAVLILAIVAGVGAIIANWDKIKAFAQKIFGGDTTQIFTQFKEFFTQVWTDIQANLTAAWNYIGPTITNAVKEIQSFWNEVWPQIKQVFVEVWDVMKVLLAPAMAAMYTAISGGIGLIKGIWGPAWNLLKDTLKTAWDLMRDVVKTAWDLISGIIKVGLDILTGNWGKAWTDMKSTFSNLWKDIKGLFGDMAKDAINWGKDLIQGLIDGIKGMIGGVGDAAKAIGDKIKSFLHFSRPDEGPLRDYETWMPDFLQGLANGIIKNKDIITKAMQGLTGSMSLGNSNNSNKDYGQNLNKSLGEGISDSTDQVTKPVNNLVTTVSTTIDNLVSSFTQNGQNSDTNLGNGITDNANATINPLNTLITTITTGVKTFVQACIGHGQDTDTNLGSGITNKSGEVINAANTVTTKVGNNLDTFAKGSIKYGQGADTSIATGITNTANSVTSAATNLVNKVGSILKTFASSCVSIGKSIGDSIASGMKSSEANAVSIAKELTQKVIDAFTNKDGFDIHSPSRRLFKIGSYAIQGLINGFSSMDVKNFFQNKIASMIGSASGVGGSLQSWLATALAITGQSMAALPALEQIAMHESGGNPNAINLWDSNAAAGHPSKGLMQTIDETFNRFAIKGLGNIWNPIANAVAAIRYMVSRYGSVMNVPGIVSMANGGSYVGYATGTDNASEGAHPVAENGIEIVLGKALKWFSGGETVLNNADSMKLIGNIKTAIDTVRSLGNMSFNSIPAIKTETKKDKTDSESGNSNKPANIYFVINSEAVAKATIDDINKLQGDIQIKTTRLRRGRK